MPFLDAALAFAVTMLVVAMVVARIVDFIHDAYRLRYKLFEKMLDKIKTELKSRLMEGEQQLSQEAVTAINAKIDKLKKQDRVNDGYSSLGFWLQITLYGKLQDSISSQAFINALLKDNQLVAKLTNELNVTQKVLTEQIEAKFAAVEKHFTGVYRELARWKAVIVAFVLALAINIDSVNIADTYIHNPVMRTAVASQGDQVISNYQQAAAKLNATAEKVEKAGKEEDQAAVEQLKASAEEIKKQIAQLNSGSFPIGWSYFPYWPYYGKFFSVFGGDGFRPANSWETRWRWVVGIFLTALCAGLGTPFWYDVISNLTKLAHMGKTDNTRPAQTNRDQPKQQPAPQQPVQQQALHQQPQAVPEQAPAQEPPPGGQG